jgi:acyl-CoA reductase-like NAD-dependent aldehyde dehydrogenase
MKDPHEYVKSEPYPLYIGGEFVPSRSRETFDIINPVDNKAFAQANKGGKEDILRAVAAARTAIDEGPWGAMTQKERSVYLMKMRDLLPQYTEKFACLETLDCGKVYPGTAFYEIPNGIDGFEYYAGKARCLEGKVIPVVGGLLNYVLNEPYGVVAEILPWNGPFMMGCHKVAAILAAGNSVIIKPSSWASLSLLELAGVFHEAGFPPGVVNVVTGPGSLVGRTLVENEDVDFISMTGGTETGRRILESSVNTVKSVALELGGKSPIIVFEDVDFESTVRWAGAAFTINSGQVCVAGTRLILHESIYEEFLEGLNGFCAALKPGNGFDYETGVNFGPVISREHFDTVWGYIESGRKEGARLICGGERYKDPALAAGNFVPPTVFADVTPNMRIFKEEIFGPVLSVSAFKTEEEALALANAVDYGLAGAVFTNDIKRAHRVAGKIKSGQVYINNYFNKNLCESPGAGWKESGIGAAGIMKYMRQKTVFIDQNIDSAPPF